MTLGDSAVEVMPEGYVDDAAELDADRGDAVCLSSVPESECPPPYPLATGVGSAPAVDE